MPFIGKLPETGAFRLIDGITTSATDTYALTVEGDHYFPESARNLIVSLNGVTQAPEAAYTVSGSHIVFASALTSSDVIDYILVIGEAVDIGTPSDNTVGNAQLKSSLDLSGKTLTFSADQVSGDAINGGTISSFASTGIDDNASATVMTVAGGSSGNNSIIQSVNSNYNAGFYGSSADFGFEISDGGVGGKTVRIKNNSTEIFAHNQVQNIIDMSNASSVTVAGFTSTGIDDNATSTAITIDSSENVGIGTGASVSAPLHVGRAASGTYSVFDDGANGRFTFASVTGATNENRIFSTTTGFAQYEDINIVADNFLFSSGGPTGLKMKIGSSGNIGIGEPSPSNLLTLKSASQYQGLTLKNASNIIADLVGFGSGNDAGGLKLYNGGSSKVQLLSNGGSYLAGGNVSIGTTTTSKGRLTVEGVSPATNNNTLALVSAAGSSKKAGISFYGTFTLPTTDTSPRRAADITAGFSTHNWGTEYMAFHVGTGATNDAMAVNTERVRIDGQGRLLVGATSIAANVKAVIQGGQGTEALRLTNASGGSGDVQGGTYLGFHMWQSQSAAGYVHSPVQIGAVETSVADYDAHLVFKTRSSNSDIAATERVRITDTGSMLVGTTATMSQGGGGPLQVYSASGSQIILAKGNGAPSMSFGSTTAQYGLIEGITGGGLKFYTGNGTISPRMTINSGGDLLVDTTSGGYHKIYKNSPGNYALQVHNKSATNPYVIALTHAATSGSGAYFIVCADNANRFLVNGNGNCLNVNNSYGAISDARYKSNIKDASSQIEDIMSVQVRSYDLNETGVTHIGVVAQELEASGMSGLVEEDEEGLKSVKYSVLYMKAIKALQEAVSRIETLEAEVAALKGA